MASYVAFLFCALFPLSNGQIFSAFTSYQEILACQDGTNGPVVEFFNAVTLACYACQQNSTLQKRSADGLTCECKPGFRYKKNFGGSLVECEPCQEAVSEDGWECATCPGTVDPVTKKCSDCTGDDAITVFRQLDGGFPAGNQEVTCQTCSSQTQPNDEKDQCERCSQTISIREDTAGTTAVDCRCDDPNTEKKLRGICFEIDQLPPSSTTLYLIELENDISLTSYYLLQNLEAEYALCRTYRSIRACQALANMCVLILYQGGPVQQITGGSGAQACSLLSQLTEPEFFYLKPQIFTEDDAEDVIESDDLNIQWTVDPIMQFPFLVGQFALDGNFEGYKSITGGLLQLCEAGENILDAAYDFGTYYSHQCSILGSSLWDQVKYPLKFYEVYIQYPKPASAGTGDNIYRIPVKILNYRNSQGQRVNQDTIRDWQLMRRFFLVDSVATREVADQDANNVRYAKNIHLRVELRSESSDGYIFIPYFEIEYDDISKELADQGAKVDISFKVSYSMSQSGYMRDFQIAIGTLSSLAILYAGFRTYVWSRRAGRLTIDFPTLANFIFYLCGSLANCFFIVTFGIAFYFFIFYKRQNVIYLVHPEGQAYEEWLALFASAFVLKTLALIHMIVMQCSADIFMIDWERPKGQLEQGDSGKKQGNSVSIWRTYFVANEWNEIQTKRKINRIFQIFCVLFFLSVLGFEDTTTKDPDGTVNKDSDVYMSEQSPMYRMALASTVYLVVAVVQIIFFLFVYERFITDDIREFVDLCSMSNVSVFVMAHGEFGYYIHGRSVHGCSDVGMKEMSDMIEREEKDLVGQRGLVPNTEQQTFMMALPKRLRRKYEAVYMDVQQENAMAVSRGEKRAGPASTKSIEAYKTLNRFLCAFIEHSWQDIDYFVKEKNLLEKVLDTEFLELSEKGIFYQDNGHSFDNVLFYGNELMLLIFDLLFFCIVDLIFENFVLAGIVTYLVTELVCLARDTGGKKNLAKKTLVDERFLI